MLAGFSRPGVARVGLVVLFCLLPLVAPGEEDFKERLPRIKPHSPADALQTFTVAPGFRIEQVAAEPLVYDPVAMAFDEHARLFVVEMRDYSEDDKAHLGRVRMLTDRDGDGKFDESSVYVDKLSWPTALICYDGGVYVGAPPDIWYCKDTNNDGQADVREKVYTGFSRSNVQGMLNSFRWGLDNRIHAATSTGGATIVRADIPTGEGNQPLRANGRDFSFDPRTRELRLESGGAQHGMCFDAWGRKFVTSNSDHLQQVMFEDHYIARNPQLAAPSPRVSIAADGPAAPVFRTSPVEPWRIVRTELRVSGKVPGVVEGGGKPAGYFTGATGAVAYTGNAWPAEYQDIVVIGDVGSNLAHRKRLTGVGVQLVGRRIDKQSEFVSSSDIWFRPCQFANAPDGTLYISDVYREVIEHPKSLPPMIKKHLDLTSGRDRGRIYRVVPDGFKQPTLADLGKADTAELVATLAHPNGWHRLTAGRLLWERQDKQAIPLLVKLAAESTSPFGRMHALYVLDSLSALRAEVLLPRLADGHPRVREHAVRLSSAAVGKSPALRERLYALADDPDQRVRYQLAFTLGDVAGSRSTEALAQLARHDAGDRWCRLAILSSCAGRAGSLLAGLAADQKFRSGDSARVLLGQLAQQVGLAATADQVADVLKSVETLPPGEQSLAQHLIQMLTQGLAKSGSPLREKIAGSGQAGALLGEMIATAKKSATNAKLPDAKRVEAIRSLGLATFAEARDVLPELLDGRQPQAVQSAAIAAMGRFREPEVADIVLTHWATFSPAVRNEAAEALFARTERLLALLAAIEKKQVQVTQIDPARLRFLLNHQDEKIRTRAKQVLGDVKLARRGEVVEAHRDVLKLDGSADHGRTVFRKICAACHRLEGQGTNLAPDLATIQNRGAETILLNVLDPNREVNPQYLNYIVITDDGQSLTGIISAETATSITLKRAEGKSDTILRSNIDQLQSTGLSIMPEGLEKQLSKQDLADVIAYLLSIK